MGRGGPSCRSVCAAGSALRCAGSPWVSRSDLSGDFEVFFNGGDEESLRRWLMVYMGEGVGGVVDDELNVYASLRLRSF